MTHSRNTYLRTASAGRYERNALSVFAQEGRTDAEKVWIQIYYNGGFPRTHQVSVGFLRRLAAWIDRNGADIEWRLIKPTHRRGGGARSALAANA